MDINSKISSIEVYNFMGYKYAKAVFDESGILNLKGYNNSGKSAFEMAIVVCLMNLYVSKQLKYIHHGEKYFRVVVSFDDGVSIVRDKYANGQSLYEMHHNGKCVYSSKRGNQLTKISGVPDPIKSYLGLIETSLGYLNYQTRRDPLWLVETKGSENYSVFNEIFRTEEISRANAMINSDINKLNSDIAGLEADLQRKELRLEACIGISKSLISAIEDKENEIKILGNKYSVTESIDKGISEIKSIRIPEEVAEINSQQYSLLSEIENTVKGIENTVVFEEVSTLVGSEQLTALKSLEKLISTKEFTSEVLDTNIEEVDFSKLSQLAKIVSAFKSYMSSVKEEEKIKSELAEVEKEKSAFIESMKKEGKVFVECENCGTLMEVSLDAGI